jgi:8-oxo-dGTP diphosphatase
MAAMTVYVVRHAKAGSRSSWKGDDVDRPLTKDGRKQAAEIATRLGHEGPTGLFSSPYVRCMQTLEPLGEQLGLPVHADERLAEDSPQKDVMSLLTELANGAVLCSHGDVIPELIQALIRRGMDVTGEADWRKATIWILEGDDATDATALTSGRVEPPPS